jgi:Mrp family chromosome partitioning ATPase/capsular polysaccharide biosynthesis protein
MITLAEVRSILLRILRWWWLVVLAVAMAGGSAYYLSANETRYYVAHASLRVGNTLENPIPDQNQLSIGWSLARYYGELARREPILQPVQQSLKLPFTWQIISDRMLTTNVVPSANLLEVYITDTSPERAALLANAIGEQLIAFSPNAPEKIQAEQQAIQQQLRASEQQRQELQTKIDELTVEQQSATSASDLAEINQKLALLQANLQQEQSSYTSLLNYKNTSIINSLDFFERAAPPSEPLPSKRKVMVAFGGLAGLILSLAAIYLLERLDPRLGGPADIEDQLKIVDLGRVPLGPPIMLAPDHLVGERTQATREVQTNILLAASEQTTRVLLITSPQSSEARTAFSIDLASMFGSSGHRVLIVDADFTESLLTRMLAQPGTQHTWMHANGAQPDAELWSYLRPTILANVAFLPGRGTGNGAPAMIPSLRWRELVQRLTDTADLIIFDGPSALHGPDAALLAPHVDGIVLTLDPRTDGRDDVTKSKTRLLHQKGTRLLGAVTFTPSRQKPWHGSIIGQLTGTARLELPGPSSAPQEADPVVMQSRQEPIITPLHDTPVQAEPIITPAPEPEPAEQALAVGESAPAQVEPPKRKRRSKSQAAGAGSDGAHPAAQPQPARQAGPGSAATGERNASDGQPQRRRNNRQ